MENIRKICIYTYHVCDHKLHCHRHHVSLCTICSLSVAHVLRVRCFRFQSVSEHLTVKSWIVLLMSKCKCTFNSIGNHTVKRVVFFLNHINQRVGRWVLINHHEWREWNDRNEWWLIRTHRPTSWLMWFRKNTTSLRCDFWLIHHQNLDHYAFD